MKTKNANCHCGCGNHCWFVVVRGELKTRLTIILYVLLVILNTAHANRRSLTVPALAFVYSLGKVSDILSNYWH